MSYHNVKKILVAIIVFMFGLNNVLALGNDNNFSLVEYFKNNKEEMVDVGFYYSKEALTSLLSGAVNLITKKAEAANYVDDSNSLSNNFDANQIINSLLKKSGFMVSNFNDKKYGNDYDFINQSMLNIKNKINSKKTLCDFIGSDYSVFFNCNNEFKNLIPKNKIIDDSVNKNTAISTSTSDNKSSGIVGDLNKSEIKSQNNSSVDIKNVESKPAVKQIIQDAKQSLTNSVEKIVYRYIPVPGPKGDKGEKGDSGVEYITDNSLVKNDYRVAGYGGYLVPPVTETGTQNGLIGVSTIGYIKGSTIESSSISGSSISGGNISGVTLTNVTLGGGSSSSNSSSTFNMTTATTGPASSYNSSMNSIYLTNSALVNSVMSTSTILNSYMSSSTVVNSSISSSTISSSTLNNSTLYLTSMNGTTTMNGPTIMNSTLAVGTTTPATGKAATFVGDIKVTGTIDPTRILFSGLANTGTLSPSYSPAANGNNYSIRFEEGGNLNFQSNTSNDIFHLANNGNVGIGTSTLQSESRLTIGPAVLNSTIEGGQLALLPGTSKNTSWLFDNYDNNFRILRGNAVGGSVSSVMSIDTNNLTTFNNLVTIRNSGNNSGIKFDNTVTGRDYRILQKDNGRLYFTDETAGAERLYLDPNGSLNVLGYAEFRDAIRVTGQRTGFNDGGDAVTFCNHCDGGGSTADDQIRNDWTGADFSIYANGRVGGNLFMAFSDARIKNILGTSTPSSDLDTLNKIAIKDYYLKDDVFYHGTSSSKSQKKVIAQELEQIDSNLVTKSNGIVMLDKDKMFHAYVEKVDGNNKIISTSTELVSGKLYRYLNTKDGSSGEFLGGSVTSLPVNSDLVITHEGVNDFRSVDYDGLTTLAISGIQALDQKLNTGMLSFSNSSSSANLDLNSVRESLVSLRSEPERDTVAFISDKLVNSYKIIQDFTVMKLTSVRGYFGDLFADNVKTKNLCVGNTCVDEAALKDMMKNSNVSPASVGTTIQSSSTNSLSDNITNSSVFQNLNATSSSTSSVSTILNGSSTDLYNSIITSGISNINSTSSDSISQVSS